MAAHTWPGPKKPWTQLCGDRRIEAMGGGTRTWETSREKSQMPSCLACHTVMALAGAVVSKPMTKNTT
jgi:hypothetical protein